MDALWQLLLGSWHTLHTLIIQACRDPGTIALRFIPYALFLELPLYFTIMLQLLRWAQQRQQPRIPAAGYYPRVSCIVLCYAEGAAIQTSIRTLLEQIYPGHIEIIVVVDGSQHNHATYAAVQGIRKRMPIPLNRHLQIVPKLQRGGRVSGMNAALSLVTGEVIMMLDGDTSFDNDMVAHAVPHFIDPHVVAVSGNLRVRNITSSPVTCMQGIEYMLSISTSRIGLSQINAVNNVSGAFGIFRHSFIKRIGGWDNGTAEDLDMTLRIKKYFGRYPELKIVFEPYAIGHTDVPDSLRGFFKQRLRWDGDLSYLYLFKHNATLRPQTMGWTNFVMLLWSGMFFQVVLPFCLLSYLLYLLLAYPLRLVLGVMLFIYLFYLAIAVLFFLEYLLLVSERPGRDFPLLAQLPLFPIFAFASRLWCGVATLTELTLKTHLDSSMAPWWVLKKTKF